MGSFTEQTVTLRSLSSISVLPKVPRKDQVKEGPEIDNHVLLYTPMRSFALTKLSSQPWTTPPMTSHSIEGQSNERNAVRTHAGMAKKQPSPKPWHKHRNMGSNVCPLRFDIQLCKKKKQLEMAQCYDFADSRYSVRFLVNKPGEGAKATEQHKTGLECVSCRRHCFL